MKKFIAILVALTAVLGSGLSEAQVRIKPMMNPNVMVPRALKTPRVQPAIPPKFLLLPPSIALKRAMAMNPGAKPLGVKLRGQTYIVRLKQGGTITQLGVNPVTGAASPLP